MNFRLKEIQTFRRLNALVYLTLSGEFGFYFRKDFGGREEKCSLSGG
jgi:hypothetical protein